MNKAQAYLRHQDSYVLVERHAPLVKRIAQHLLARLPSSVLLDDLIQAGMIGLL
ncbi:sigma factor, partial [Aeromonas veronii]